MNTQLHSFPDGGFVIHKITHPKMAGRLSAWYDKNRNVIDCEAFDSLNRARPIKPGSFAWDVAQKVGKTCLIPKCL